MLLGILHVLNLRLIQIGIVGWTGAGKTSMILAPFHILKGAILVNDVNITDHWIGAAQ